MHFLWNGAVGARTDVHQQIPVLAHDIHELVNNDLRRFEAVVLNKSPRFIADRGVRLPVQRANIIQLPAFHVQHRRVFLHRIVFVIDHSHRAAAGRVVVIKSRKLGEVAAHLGLANPPIEINYFGLIFFNNFRTARQPIVQIRVADVRPIRIQRLLAFQPVVRGSVQIGILWIIHIRREQTSAVQEKIMLDAMGRRAQVQSFVANGLRQFAQNISSRTHLSGGPIGKSAVVHREAVMMFKNRNDIFRAGLFEKTGPSRSVKMLGAKHGNKILITKLCQRPIGAEVMLIFGGIQPVHIARIPFISVSRHGIHAPVNKNSELRILIPIRSLVFLE